MLVAFKKEISILWEWILSLWTELRSHSEGDGWSG